MLTRSRARQPIASVKYRCRISVYASDIGLYFDILLRRVTVCYTGVSDCVCLGGALLLAFKLLAALNTI